MILCSPLALGLMNAAMCCQIGAVKNKLLKRYDDDCLIKLVMGIGYLLFWVFLLEFAVLVSDSLNVLRMPRSKVLAWHTVYNELPAVSLLLRKYPLQTLEDVALGALLSHVATLHGVRACTTQRV